MIADLHVYELGDVMLLTMAGDVKDDGAGEARSVHLLRGCAARRRDRDVRADGGGRARTRRGPCRPRSARWRPTRWRRCPSTGTCAPSGPAAPAIVTRVTDTGEPGFDVFVDRAQVDRARRPRSTPPASSKPARRRPRRCASRRACRRSTATWTRRRSRSRRHRVARDQLQQGLLRRAGSRHPRAAPRPRPRGAQAGRPARRRRAGAAAGCGDSQRRPGDRPGHEQHAGRRRSSGRSRSATCTATFSSRGRRSPSRTRPPRSRRCRSCRQPEGRATADDANADSRAARLACSAVA